MIREPHDLRSGFSPREIAMRLERYLNLMRETFRDCVKAFGYPITRLVTLRARLDLVRKNTNQRSTEFRCEFGMGQGYPHLISSLAGIRRMKSARSVNATDLDTVVLYICARRSELRRRKLRATK